MKESRFRKDLSIKGLLATCRKSFDALPDPKQSRGGITLSECLMSGLAIFGLKYPSLLQFDQSMDDDIIKQNLNNLYGIKRAPCDTWFRERLDEVNPEDIRKAFNLNPARVNRLL